jgi:hypothetical protein
MPAPAAYGEMVARVTKDWDVELMFEPGRVIAGTASPRRNRDARHRAQAASGRSSPHRR